MSVCILTFGCFPRTTATRSLCVVTLSPGLNSSWKRADASPRTVSAVVAPAPSACAGAGAGAVETTLPRPFFAASCARATGMQPTIFARCPTTGRFHDFSAMRKESLNGLAQITCSASTNWLAWLPVKITGPFRGTFSMPTISIFEKTVERMTRKKMRIEK